MTTCLEIDSVNRKTLDFNKINNTRIDYFEQIIKPNELLQQQPVTTNIKNLVLKTRISISNILTRKDKRMLFIVGPCSIHNIDQAKIYGKHLKNIADKVKDKILIVMRVYFEKPRTTIGWKGLINDPDLNGTFNVNKGLKMARELLLYLNDIGLPCGYEILDTITPQYICDLISWGAIGARTTESQVHRQLVSGLSMPVGFKNGTSGGIEVAANAILSAKYPHCFMGITNIGEPAICKTKGNNDCHIILRGGSKAPNYETKFIKETEEILNNKNITSNIMVDCSHGNSKKNYKNQSIVLENLISQITNGNKTIMGVMIESNINEGKQKLSDPLKLEYGVSITDSCISIEETEKLLLNAHSNILLDL